MASKIPWYLLTILGLVFLLSLFTGGNIVSLLLGLIMIIAGGYQIHRINVQRTHLKAIKGLEQSEQTLTYWPFKRGRKYFFLVLTNRRVLNVDVETKGIVDQWSLRGVVPIAANKHIDTKSTFYGSTPGYYNESSGMYTSGSGPTHSRSTSVSVGDIEFFKDDAVVFKMLRIGDVDSVVERIKQVQKQLGANEEKMIMKEKEVIVKIRCSYCNNLRDETMNNCPHCGAHA